ncbi:unnamed protein product [Nippostrongylus brasiliensis]|uniref:Vesicular GABA transporter (inferred by orthology to a C. elegans protein) n=1 Tax=Nippostrongylus brasiliensis TaxID=27835 RepID=A0A0N4XLX2_NIPBR|nr:unnamed protein product [Nippostrongylus brasiliensis]
MMGVPYICYWTGVLLIECLYEKDKKVAEFYRPGFCKWVLAAQLTELLSTCIIYLLLAADLLQSCFPSIGELPVGRKLYSLVFSHHLSTSKKEGNISFKENVTKIFSKIENLGSKGRKWKPENFP